jgi:haloalkane dehalogenase
MPDLAVLDSTIHYRESGSGTPLVFLHGNPGSSYSWRNVLPHVGDGRLLTPDLIGMGASGKPEIAYSFADHARYLDAWFDGLELEGVILIGHDWGGAFAFDWAARHPERVTGVAFFESVIKPTALEDLPPQTRARRESLHGPDGEQMVVETDQFIRAAYTGGVLTPVAPQDLDAYLAPYPTPESRRAILALAREFPLGDKPIDVITRLDAYQPWLAESVDVPKLLITFNGQALIIDERLTNWCANHIAALEIVNCGEAGHHAAEDRPEDIAAAIKAWADRHQLRD